ncbi:hypothetical protein HZS_1645, partial [Henneguya salminicola]
MNSNAESIEKFIERNSAKNIKNDLHPDGTQFNAPGIVHSEKQAQNLNGQDMLLPLNNVLKVVKSAIPHAAKISKETRISMQESASEFISFICSEAAEVASDERRRTVR